MLSLREQNKGGVLLLEMEGRIQHEDTPKFETALEKAQASGCPRLVLDMSAISHVCSAALGVLVAHKHRTRKENVEIRLVVGPGELRSVLEMTMIHKIFPVFTTQLDALQSPRSQAI